MVLTEPSLCRLQGQDRKETVPAGCFLLRLIQASLALVAVFWPQARKASRIIDLKE